MSESNKPGMFFWIVGIIALLWMAMGSWSYIAQAFDMAYATEGLSESQIAFMDGMPAWYTALFAIAVFSGLLAALLFLMRKKSSVMLFVVSFLAALVNQIYWLFMSDAPEVFADMGTFNVYGMPILVIVLGLFFISYSKKQKVAGVLT